MRKTRNAIDLIKSDLKKHKVEVKLPGAKTVDSFYLIMILAKTDKLEDFKNVYGNKADKLRLKIAKKNFGEGETENIYGLLLDANLKVIFAFNREFADYDPEKKEIVFKDIDDVLGFSDEDNMTDMQKKFLKNFKKGFPYPGVDTVIKYGLPD